ncbi:MAG: hypothetical protein L3J07_00285 [Candidatus Magasanikbacteria bacterium]|nr:hypothetical protein [Candidatus Magasanikbacteria bacterium]
MQTVLYKMFLTLLFSLFILGCSEFGSITIAERTIDIEKICKTGTVLQIYSSLQDVKIYSCVVKTKECSAGEINTARSTCKREGLYKSVYNNGRIRTLSNYKNDKLHGKFEMYTENGFLHWQAFYINGVHTRSERIWDINTKILVYYGEYSNGKRHGEFRITDAKGRLENQSFWNNGKLKQENIFRYLNKIQMVYLVRKDYYYFLDIPITMVEQTIFENGKEVKVSLFVE